MVQFSQDVLRSRPGRLIPPEENPTMHKLPLVAVALLSAAVLLSTSRAPSADKDLPKLLKPTNLAFNTKADEDEPHIASDGRRLLYISTSEGKSTLYASTRALPTQPWRAGAEPDDLSVISEKNDIRGLFLPGEARPPYYVYYAMKKIGEKEASFDIFLAIKPLPGANKVFNEPRPIEKIDTPGDEMHPWLTDNGKSLYFSRKTKEGWRVCVSSHKMGAGPAGFEDPITLDLPPDYHHATLTPDGKTMYLQGPLEKGRWGLFVSTKTDKGWSLPEELNMLNHPEGPTGDRSPNLSRDGSLLYFASDRPEGKGGLDIWVIQTAQLLKKKN
jgi:WD40-like Beta Propeller Repeat